MSKRIEVSQGRVSLDSWIFVVLVSLLAGLVVLVVAVSGKAQQPPIPEECVDAILTAEVVFSLYDGSVEIARGAVNDALAQDFEGAMATEQDFLDNQELISVYLDGEDGFWELSSACVTIEGRQRP